MISQVFAQTIFKGEAGCIQQEGINYFLCKAIGILNIFYWIGLVGGMALLMISGAKYMINPGKNIKEEMPYIILGIALIIASFSIQVIIFSLLK